MNAFFVTSAVIFPSHQIVSTGNSCAAIIVVSVSVHIRHTKDAQYRSALQQPVTFFGKYVHASSISFQDNIGADLNERSTGATLSN